MKYSLPKIIKYGQRWNSCSYNSKSKALTLIEVLVGLAIIAFVSSSVMVARAKLSQQAIKARQKLEACKVMDEILAANLFSSWAVDSEPDSKHTGSGSVNTDSGQWTWQMQRTRGEFTEVLIADCIEVKLFSPGGEAKEAILKLELPVAQIVQENEEDEDSSSQ